MKFSQSAIATSLVTGSAMETGLVSICIPTYKRNRFLAEAVQSCLAQDYAPIEILIGDDSNDAETRRLCESFALGGRGVKVRYFGHVQRLGQAGNINRLMDEMRGEFFVLLHDDDKLVGNCISRFVRILRQDENAIAVFGVQQIIDEESRIDYERTDALNRAICRTSQYEGTKLSSMASALRQQIHNDAFMVRARCVTDIRFRGAEVVGSGCDFDFCLMLAKRHGGHRFHFLNDVTAQYRLSPGQISKAPLRYPMLAELERISVEDDAEAERALLLQKDKFARRAIREFLASGNRNGAWEVFRSDSYLRKEGIGKGVALLALMILPRRLSQALSRALFRIGAR